MVKCRLYLTLKTEPTRSLQIIKASSSLLFMVSDSASSFNGAQIADRFSVLLFSPALYVDFPVPSLPRNTGKGYLNFDQVSPDVSVPRTVNTPGAHEGFIPCVPSSSIRYLPFFFLSLLSAFHVLPMISSLLRSTIPSRREGVYQIRNGLRRVYPQLAERDFIGTRLCWYSDTENGEWIIDRHQTIGGLIFATGGSVRPASSHL